MAIGVLRNPFPGVPTNPPIPPQSTFQSAVKFNPNSKYGVLMGMYGNPEIDENQLDKFKSMYSQNKNSFGFNY